MDPERVTLVLCLVILIVVGVNGVLLAAFLRGRRIGEFELLQKAAKTARNPLRRDQAELDELARRVAEFKERPAEPAPDEHHNSDNSDQV